MKNYDEYLYLELWTYNPEYEKDEDNAIAFLIPLDWVKKQVYDFFKLSIEEFMEWYTYDHSELLYREAVKDLAIKHTQSVGGGANGNKDNAAQKL